MYCRPRRYNALTRNPTPLEVADLLEGFLDGTSGSWDWDDFISVPIEDDRLETVRKRCAELSFEFPTHRPGYYCGEEGFEVIRNYIRTLRQPDPPKRVETTN
jgi:hypothetical protein